MLHIRGISLERPPRVLCVIAALWVSSVVIIFSDAGVPFPTWFGVSLLGIGVTVFGLLRFSMTYLISMRGHPSWIRRHYRWWILTTLIIAMGFLLAGTSQLLRVRLYMSAKALQESGPLLSAVPSGNLYSEGRWVGLFRVHQFEQFGSEMRFITNECGVIDSCGIVFSS